MSQQASSIARERKTQTGSTRSTEEQKSHASSRFSKSQAPSKQSKITASKQGSKRLHLRKLSPLAEDPKHYECRLPNDDENYSHSPVARHALADGSLDPNATFFNRTFNRKLKMRDTFTKIFPGYQHGTPSVAMRSTTQRFFVYPESNEWGNPICEIDREYTLKKDYIKEFSEMMLRQKNMARTSKK